MITKDQVKKIAQLSYIELNDKEIAKYTKELSQILDFFELLNKIDTENVAPLICSSDLESVIFEDNPHLSSCNKELVKRAPQRQGNYIKSKAIFNTEE